jgi:hypothetical protein
MDDIEGGATSAAAEVDWDDDDGDDNGDDGEYKTAAAVEVEFIDTSCFPLELYTEMLKEKACEKTVREAIQ